MVIMMGTIILLLLRGGGIDGVDDDDDHHDDDDKNDDDDDDDDDVVVAGIVLIVAAAVPHIDFAALFATWNLANPSVNTVASYSRKSVTGKDFIISQTPCILDDRIKGMSYI